MKLEKVKIIVGKVLGSSEDYQNSLPGWDISNFLSRALYQSNGETPYNDINIWASGKTYSLYIWLQWPLTKSQARGWPTTLPAIETMVEVASCLRIFSGSRQYSRYLQRSHSEDKSLIQMSRACSDHTAGRRKIVLGSSSWTWVMLQNDPWMTITNTENIMSLCVSATHLFSSQGCLVQDRACISLSASEAIVAFLYMDQAKSHSSTPPAASALQYTVDFKLGLILEQLIRLLK